MSEEVHERMNKCWNSYTQVSIPLYIDMMRWIWNCTWTSPLGPVNSSGSAAKSQKATSPVRAVRRDRVKSMRVTVTPLVDASMA